MQAYKRNELKSPQKNAHSQCNPRSSPWSRKLSIKTNQGEESTKPTLEIHEERHLKCQPHNQPGFLDAQKKISSRSVADHPW